MIKITKRVIITQQRAKDTKGITTSQHTYKLDNDVYTQNGPEATLQQRKWVN
jgi:hypothetical protein